MDEEQKRSIGEILGGYLSDAIQPIKRIPEVYQEQVESGMDLMGSDSLLDKGLGAFQYVSAPITAPFEALREEPIKDALVSFGVDPDTARNASMIMGMGLDVALPVTWAKMGLDFPREISTILNTVAKPFETTARLGTNLAGTATMGGAKVAQNLTGANIVPTVAKAVGPRRLSMGRLWTPQFNTRKDSTTKTGKFQAQFEAPSVQGRGGWYGGVANKLNHLKEMFSRARTGGGMDRPLLMGDDMKTYLTSLGDDLLQESKPALVTGGHSVTGQLMRPAGSDALVAQILQTADTAMRYFPNNPESIRLNKIVDEILRNKVNTTVSKMSTEPSVVREVLLDGLGPDMTDDVLSKHLIPFIKTDLSLTKTQPHKNVRIASKPFYRPNPAGNSASKGYSVDKNTGIPEIEPDSKLWDWNGRLPVLREVQMLVNGGVTDKKEIIKILMERNDLIKAAYLARNEPIPTMKNQLKGLAGAKARAMAKSILAKYEKTRVGNSALSQRAVEKIGNIKSSLANNPSLRKTLEFIKEAYKVDNVDLDQAKALNDRLYNRDILEKLIVEDGNHISVSQWVLGEDTLLATYPTRMIINKNDGTGAYVMYDQMAPGVPIPGMQGMGNIGSDTHSLYMDIIPISKTDLKNEPNVFSLGIEEAFTIPKKKGSPGHQTGEFQSVYPKLRENLLGL